MIAPPFLPSVLDKTLTRLTLTNAVLIGASPNSGLIAGGAIEDTGSGTPNSTNTTLSHNSVQEEQGFRFLPLYAAAIVNTKNGTVNTTNSTLAYNSAAKSELVPLSWLKLTFDVVNNQTTKDRGTFAS